MLFRKTIFALTCALSCTTLAIQAQVNVDFEDIYSSGGSDYASGTYDSGLPNEYTWSYTGDKPSDREDSFIPSYQGSDDGIKIENTGTLVIDFGYPVTDLFFALSEYELGPYLDPNAWERAVIEVYDISGALLNSASYIDQQGSEIAITGTNTYDGIDDTSNTNSTDIIGTLSFDFGSLVIDRIEIAWDTSDASLRFIEPRFTAILPCDANSDAPLLRN